MTEQGLSYLFPAATQAARLQEILERNRDTEYGREFGFRNALDPDAFRRQVPVIRHETIRYRIDRMLGGKTQELVSEPVIYFGESSGTTGEPKLIPVTESFVQEYSAGYGTWSQSFERVFPDCGFDGLLQLLVPIPVDSTPGTVPRGPILGCFRRLGLPEFGVSQRDHWLPPNWHRAATQDERLYLVIRAALMQPLQVILTLEANFLLMLARKLAEFADMLIEDVERGGLASWVRAPQEAQDHVARRLLPNPSRASDLRKAKSALGSLRPREAWPTLQGLVCLKFGSMKVFIDQLPQFYGDLPIMDSGYAATEGVFAVPLSCEDGNVMTVGSHFYEFISRKVRAMSPDDPYPQTLLLEEVEEGEEYHVVLTASNGLYRYDMEDVVRVVGKFLRTPRVQFLHRAGAILSIVGEKVGETHVVESVAAAAHAQDVCVYGASVAIRVEPQPRYVLAVETDSVLDPARFVGDFETELCRLNPAYRVRRMGRCTLQPPHLLRLTPGAYQAYRERRSAAVQVKPPVLFESEEALRRALPVAGEF